MARDLVPHQIFPFYQDAILCLAVDCLDTGRSMHICMDGRNKPATNTTVEGVERGHGAGCHPVPEGWIAKAVQVHCARTPLLGTIMPTSLWKPVS